MEEFYQAIPKWSQACYAVGSMFHISNIKNLQPTDFAYFHPIISVE
jgi:hypothetical protein